MNKSNPHQDAYKAAVRMIDAQRRLLADAGADPNVLTGLTAVVRYLHRLPEKQIDRLFGINSSRPSREVREKAIHDASSFELGEIERIVKDESVSRADLEAIAIGRFHVPRGSMRSLGNIERLREKIKIFVENERTHETITRLAGNPR